MEIKDLFDIPTGSEKIINAALSGLHDGESLEEDRIKWLKKIRRHTVYDKACHIPRIDFPTHIDHDACLSIDSLAGLEHPLFVPLHNKVEYSETFIPEDLDEWKAKPDPTNKEICDKRNSAKKRDKKKVKAQKKARKINRR